MRRKKNKSIYYLFILLILGISIGYAYLNTTLNINGTTNVSSASWNIYWNNIQLGTNNVTTVTTPATISTGKTEVSFNVDFKEPGDTYEFTVDAVNDGTIDAMISTFSKGVYASNGTTPKALPDYLEYTVTYSDGVEIANKQLLESGKTETYKVRVHYKEDITASQLPSTADNYMFKFGVTYAQADDTSTKVVPDPESFSTDSWETISRAAKSGNISAYHVGDTKTVDMGTFGTHTLRIANTTTPAECSTEGFSQTACGVVLEFADIITTHRMNPYVYGSTEIGNGNIGGWPASEMRAYVNSEIYNALPEALRNTIINTTVVSGHCGTEGETNFTSTDKLYLLSSREIWEIVDDYSGNGIDRDTAFNNSRQLDYYKNQGVTTKDYSGAIKQYNGSNTRWWLRSFMNESQSIRVYHNGYPGTDLTNTTTFGVSPAFRIA